MALLPTTLDYTDKDFESLRERLINIIRGVYPDWTDFDVANFSNIVIESFAFVGDVLTGYQDRQAGESRLRDATLRQNVLALAAHLGYRPSASSAATTDVLITLDAVPSNNTIIPAGSTFRTRDVSGAVVFQLLTDVSIAAGLNPPQAFGLVENSQSISGEVAQSTGVPNQDVQLIRTPYIDRSLSVVAANGVFTEVENFLSSTSSDLHYTLVVDAEDRARVRFGNGVTGALPVGQIFFDYKIGGGTSGNVDRNTISIVDNASSFTDVLGVPVRLSVSNQNPARGGQGRETIAQIKQNAPQARRITDRTVSLEDYTIAANAVPGVARSLMVTSDQLPGLPENRGRLYVVPVGGGTPSSGLLANVLTAVTVTRPNTITFQVTTLPAVYTSVNIACTVFLTASAAASTVAAAVRSRLASFFSIQNIDGSRNTAIDFGINYSTGRSGNQEAEIPFSDVYNVVRDTPGVRKIGDRDVDFTLNGASSDLAIPPVAFPVLGDIIITDGDTGALL